MSELAIGIDLGGTKINAGIIDSEGHILELLSQSTPQTGRGQDILNTIENLCGKLQQNFSIRALGIGSPGLIDSAQGVIMGCTPNLADWQGRNLKAYFYSKFDCPVVVDNDANMACYGEWKKGAGNHFQDMVLLTLGTGLGSGIVTKGFLSRGHNHLGVGFGHMIIEAQGRHCNCGQQGCLESYVSGKGLVKTYLLLGGESGVKGEEIFERAESGDILARNAIDLFIRYLAIGVVNIFNTLAPQSIVIGGGISNQGEKRLLQPLKEAVMSIMSMPFQHPESLQIAQLGSDAGMIGAGLMALEELHSG